MSLLQRISIVEMDMGNAGVSSRMLVENKYDGIEICSIGFSTSNVVFRQTNIDGCARCGETLKLKQISTISIRQ